MQSQKFRKYSSSAGEFYLALGVITENGEPKTSIERWDADHALETQYSAPEGLIKLPTYYHSFAAAEQDLVMRDSIFSYPDEWQSTLILNPNAKTETSEYVLMNDRETPLKASKHARSLNPMKIHKDGERYVVIANDFDIPFRLQEGRHNGLEDLDPITGFFNFKDKPPEQGKHGIYFDSGERLYAAILNWGGDADCYWEPGDSHDAVGARGLSIGNLPESLLESETDVLKARLERREREIVGERQDLLVGIERIETHYSSGLEQLKALRSKLTNP